MPAAQLNRSRPTRIIVDQDEVLAQFVQAVLDRWNVEHGTSWTRDQVNMWQMEDLLGPEAKSWIPRTISEPSFFADLEPMPGALLGLNRLIRLGYDVVIATHVLDGNENVYDGKRRWMRQWFPDFPLKNFIAISRKELLDADILIDDGAHNIQAWLDAGHSAAIIMDAPWNQGTYPGATRFKDWNGIIDHFDKMEKLGKLISEMYALRIPAAGGGYVPDFSRLPRF